MEWKEYLPFWKDLNEIQKSKLERSVSRRRAAKGTLLHSGSGDCVGLFLIMHGMLRACLLYTSGSSLWYDDKWLGRPCNVYFREVQESGPVSYTHLDVYKRQLSKRNSTHAASHAISFPK